MHFKCEEMYMLEINGWKKISPGNSKYKKARMYTLGSDKIHLEGKHIARDKERYFIKGSIYEEDLTITNM